MTERAIQTAHGAFRLVAYVEKVSNASHLALVYGDVAGQDETLVRVHEPTSIVDILDAAETGHSWGVGEALAHVASAGSGVIVLLNCSESAGQLIERVSDAGRPRVAAKQNLLTYGIGAQILRDLGVVRMRLMSNPRKMPSMAGWGLEVTGYVQSDRVRGR